VFKICLFVNEKISDFILWKERLLNPFKKGFKNIIPSGEDRMINEILDRFFKVDIIWDFVLKDIDNIDLSSLVNVNTINLEITLTILSSRIKNILVKSLNLHLEFEDSCKTVNFRITLEELM
jgi:hypothetical protein